MIALRDYQIDVTDRARARMADRGRRGVIQGETGSGKTVVGAELCRLTRAKGNRALVLADRRRLVKQFGATLEAMGVPYGVIMAGETGATREPIVLASRDTFATWVANDREFPEPDLILVDECHKSMGMLYQVILGRFPRAFVIGLTATPARDDGKSLGDFYSWIECTVPASQLVREGWLMPCEVYAPLELAAKRKRGDQTRGLAGDPVSHWQTHADGLPTIAFASKLSEAEALCDRFRTAGIAAECVNAGISDDAGWDGKSDRDRYYDRLANGATKVLCSVGLLVEGVDIPEASAVIIWSKFGSVVKWRQACLDSATEVLTNRGWVGMGGILPGDQVATFDTATERIHWCRPRNVFSRPISTEETMYAMRGVHLDVRVTNDHAMVYRCKGETAKRWLKKTAEELASMPSKVRIPVSGSMDAAGVPLTDDELRFVGWFMTDGCLNRKNNIITISQSAASPYVSDIERCLKGCGFRYRTYQRQRVGRWAGYADSMDFRVCYGKRAFAADPHLTGWGRLAPYLDKSLAPALEEMTADQLGVLLEAMNLGDGVKRKNIDWIQRTLTIGTGNKTMADRIQSLCVRRGFSCNIATATKGRERPFYSLLIRRGVTSRTAKVSDEFRPDPAERQDPESVWCMTTEFGTLVTRRHGRVAIVGNCGRAMRPCPRIGKTKAVVLDHAGAAGLHGLPGDDVQWSLDLGSTVGDRREKAIGEGKLAATVICRACGFAYSGKPACPTCGKAAPRVERRRTMAKEYEATTDAILERFDGEQARDLMREQRQRAWVRAIYTAIGRNGTAGMAANVFRRTARINPWDAGVEPLPEGRGDWRLPAAEVWPQFVRAHS